MWSLNDDDEAYFFGVELDKDGMPVINTNSNIQSLNNVLKIKSISLVVCVIIAIFSAV